MTSASSLSSTSSSSGVSLTDIFHAFNNTDHDDNDGNNQWQDQVSGQKDLYTQVVIASALGLAAFMGFCVCFFVLMMMGGCFGCRGYFMINANLDFDDDSFSDRAGALSTPLANAPKAPRISFLTSPIPSSAGSPSSIASRKKKSSRALASTPLSF